MILLSLFLPTTTKFATNTKKISPPSHSKARFSSSFPKYTLAHSIQFGQKVSSNQKTVKCESTMKIYILKNLPLCLRKFSFGNTSYHGTFSTEKMGKNRIVPTLCHNNVTFASSENILSTSNYAIPIRGRKTKLYYKYIWPQLEQQQRIRRKESLYFLPKRR